jgi:hypothetical protein
LTEDFPALFDFKYLKVPRFDTYITIHSPPLNLAMRSQISTLASLLSLFTIVSASNVIDLTPSNFDDIIGSGKPALVINLHT